MRKLYILRHGETEFNTQNRYAGTMDIELNSRGIEQSEEAAQKLSECDIDIIYASTRKRAYKTAEVVNRYISKPLVKSELLVERNLGIYEGLTRDEAREKYPELWQKNVLYDMSSREHGGESVSDVKERAKKVLNDIVSKHPDENILLVTHGYISRMINSVILDLPDDEVNNFLLSNCEIAVYDLE